MEGEPKKEMYDLLPKSLYPTTFNVLPAEPFSDVIIRVKDHQLDYPLIVKPEIGGQGILFRKIDSAEELAEYHASVPVEYIVQRMVHYPIEVSVFYIRHPENTHGEITGFLHKIPLHVLGNGKDTLEQLVNQHPKAATRIPEFRSKHKDHWNTVVPADTKFILSYAANHNRGAHFIDMKDQIDDKLINVFDDISNGINDFFYGRYDIMCNSIEELKENKNFTILEYNGCGAEPNHFYDTGYSLPGAYKEILMHWKKLYSICKYNRSLGILPWSWNKGRNFLKETKEHMRIIRAADQQMN